MNHEGSEPGDDGTLVAIRSGPVLRDHIGSPGALGIAATVLGFVDLLSFHMVTVISYIHSLTPTRSSTLHTYRIDAAIHLGMGLFALLIAGLGAHRLRPVIEVDLSEDDDDLLNHLDEQVHVESWVKAVIGSGAVLALVGALLSAIALIYAFTAHAPSGNFY